MAVRHKFTNLVTDIGGPTYTQPTHWNDGHNAPRFSIYEWAAATIWAASVPSHTTGALDSVAEFPLGLSGVMRTSFDFTYVDSIQMALAMGSTLNCAQSAGSTAFRFQYMPSGFPGSWYSFDATGGSGPFISVATANNATIYLASANGPMLSPTVAVSAAAKALPQPLTVRVAAHGGSASSTVGIGNIGVFGL